MTLLSIISGGQTGVDRAALDVAMEMGLGCRGWCPKGRRAEDGPLHPRYTLQETDSAEYSVRTRNNVRDSQATLILNRDDLAGGTAATVRFAEELGKPFLVVQLDEDPSVKEVVKWIEKHATLTLNVAGPRESKAPGIYDEATAFFSEAMNLMARTSRRLK